MSLAKNLRVGVKVQGIFFLEVKGSSFLKYLSRFMKIPKTSKKRHF
jgi:hypothetical protein